MVVAANTVYEAIKRATVAVALLHPSDPKRPFTIVGSGFCIHSRGIVVTCEHVLKSFMDPASYKRVMDAVDEGKSETFSDLEGATPHVIFYEPKAMGEQLRAYPVPVSNAVSKTESDLAILKVPLHKSFPSGYPFLEIEDYGQVHEMLEIGTCGFPLGSLMQDQIGTVTSSFTKGMISSILPVPGVDRSHLRGFQLDLTATNGNSGGPVFSLASGKVFGVLQAGVMHPSGHVVQGLTKAEPVYPIFEHDLVDRLLAAPPGQARL